MKKTNKEEVVDTTEEIKEIKASRFEIEQQLNTLVGSLKVKDLSPEGKITLVHLKLALTKIKTGIEEFRKTTIDSINKPEKLDELKEAAEKENATDEVKSAFKQVEAEYNKEFAEVAIPYYNAIVSIPFNFISESDFDSIVKNNDLDALFGYEYIHDKLVR